MKACLYGRCSTDQQELSISAQNANLRSWATTHGYTVDEASVFMEEDTSGTIEFAKRKKGAALLALLAASEIKHVIVPKIDRLGRSAMDVLNTIERMKCKGVRVHILDLGGEHFDTGSAIGGMIIAVLAFASQMEVERIRERIKTALHHKASRGELCGTVPYGKNAIPTGELTGKGKPIYRVEDNPTEMSWIIQMRVWRSLGWGYHSIAKELNARNVPTKEAGRLHAGRPARHGWQTGNVARVLRNSMSNHPEPLTPLEQAA